jgi:hypothetical protein
LLNLFDFSSTVRAVQLLNFLATPSRRAREILQLAPELLFHEFRYRGEQIFQVCWLLVSHRSALFSSSSGVSQLHVSTLSRVSWEIFFSILFSLRFCGRECFACNYIASDESFRITRTEKKGESRGCVTARLLIKFHARRAYSNYR